MADKTPQDHVDRPGILTAWLGTVTPVDPENYLNPIDDFKFSGEVSPIGGFGSKMNRADASLE